MQYSNLNGGNNVVAIGDISIKLPKDYSLVNNPNYIDMSNGEDAIKIYKLNDTNLDSAVNDYKNMFSQNFTIDVDDFNSKYPAKKTTAVGNGSTVCKYWFKLNNTVYQIQVYKNDSKFDDIAKEIITSSS